jgi:hypothetical protein
MRAFLVSYAAGPRVHAQNQRVLLRSAADKGFDVLPSVLGDRSRTCIALDDEARA